MGLHLDKCCGPQSDMARDHDYPTNSNKNKQRQSKNVGKRFPNVMYDNETPGFQISYQNSAEQNQNEYDEEIIKPRTATFLKKR